MGRLLCVGHVALDRREGADVLGGAVSYASLAAMRLGWSAAIATSAGPDFDLSLLPRMPVFAGSSAATTRFRNDYGGDGSRSQTLLARADDVDLSLVPDSWRAPDALLLAPIIGEIPPGAARSFEASAVGAIAQGWLRQVDVDGRVSPKAWRDPEADLAGVHVLFLSESDGPDADASARELLRFVPMVAVTRGWHGLSLFTRGGEERVSAVPRPEVDPTGAGDVFAAAFLVHYAESEDPSAAAAFGSCAASFAVEGVGVSALADREGVLRRLEERRLYLEEEEWNEG